MWPLFLCAVIALGVILERGTALQRMRGSSELLLRAVRERVQSNDRDGALALCHASRHPAAPLLIAGLGQPVQDPPTLGLTLRAKALQATPALLERLAVLDTVITVAPLLGLLGTVTGMIGAFHVITADSGLSASFAITGGVAQALIATATGLAIAIVSLVGYNFLTEQARILITEIEQSTLDVGRLLSLPPSVVQPERRRPRRPVLKRARIEIIPMIDTIFFLLVYFMITSLSMVQVSSHRVSLPVSAKAQTKPGQKIVVTISPNGAYYVDEQQTDELSILPLVAERVKTDPNTTVLINCDKDLDVTRFLRAFDLIKQANAKTVLIATKPGGSEQPSGATLGASVQTGVAHVP